MITNEITNEGRFIIDRTEPGKHMQFPRVFKFGKHIFVSYSEAPDVYGIDLKRSVLISHDNGNTFKTKHTNPYMSFNMMYENNDTICGVDSETFHENENKTDYYRTTYWTTKDYGETWSKHSGRVYLGEKIAFPDFSSKAMLASAGKRLVFHRGHVEFFPGNFGATMYGYWKDCKTGKEECGVVWVETKNSGADWEVVSVIAKGMMEGIFSHWEGLCEPHVARVKDGSLLCVMRTGSYGPIYMSRSSDDGLTWSKPSTLPGLSREQSYSIDPQLLLMENNVLAMTYGRSGNLLAFSQDGSGYFWDCYHEVYTGEDIGSYDLSGRYKLIRECNTYTGETEGMTGIVEISPSRLLYVADQGRYPSPEPAICISYINVGLKHKEYTDIAKDIRDKRLSGVKVSSTSREKDLLKVSNILDDDPGNVFIPDIEDRISKDSSVPEYSIVLDLGTSKKLESVVVRHQFASIWKYKIEVSSDNCVWKTFADKSENEKPLHYSRDDGSEMIRYVRYTITGNKLIECYNKRIGYAIHNYISITGIELFGE